MILQCYYDCLNWIEFAFLLFSFLKAPSTKCTEFLENKTRQTLQMSDSNKMGLKRCDHCDYKASNQAILRQHKLRRHELGKYGHECQLCDKEFSRTNNLKRHIEQVHMSHHCIKCLISVLGRALFFYQDFHFDFLLQYSLSYC